MESSQTFLNQFNPHFERIDEELSKTFDSHVPLIKEIGRHSILGEGKRLRPLLFVLSCQLCGYQGDDVYKLSTTFEYVHTASLLHDDVIDNADIRRKKPSARHIWGNLAAVLTGDFLSSVASGIALDTHNLDFLRTGTNTAIRMTEGQVLELVNTNNWRIRKDEYMKIITYKTAELMSAACACGAIISGGEKEAVEHLNKFGLNLGIAFQLIDDLLDYISSEEEFGKPVGKDLKEGKITLPLIYTLSTLGNDEAGRLEKIFKDHQAKENDYERIIELVRNGDAIKRIQIEAEEHMNKAAGFLDFYPDSPEKENLVALNTFLIKRRY